MIDGTTGEAGCAGDELETKIEAVQVLLNTLAGKIFATQTLWRNSGEDDSGTLRQRRAGQV